jgi:lysophospholipase L1-like esterase
LRHWFRPAVALILIFTLCLEAAPNGDAQRRQRFQPEFDSFAAKDKVTSFAPGGILFVGSSIFRQWTDVAEMMAPLPVLNRAFGGSRTDDQLVRFDEVVTPYSPRLIVYYCGSNDLKAGDEPAEIFARFSQFADRALASRPDLRLVFVSSTRSPDREDKWPRVDCYNALVREYCQARPRCRFVDVNPLLLDATGRPRRELYRDDLLHLQAPAYVEFCRILKPELQRLWLEITSADAGPKRSGRIAPAVLNRPNLILRVTLQFL